MYHFITIVACCTVKLIIIIWVGAQSRCPGSGRLPRADGDISTSVPPNKCPLHSANDDNNPTTGWDVLKLLQTCRWKQLRRVPRAARSNLADLLSEIFSTIASEPMNVPAWIKLLLVFHHCIPAPERGRRHAGSLTAWINQRIRDFRSNPLVAPWGGRCSDGSSYPGVKRDERARLATAVAERIEDGDVKGAIRLASSNDTIALNTPETVERLRPKHNSRPANRRD